jgi:hypothetical protein
LGQNVFFLGFPYGFFYNQHKSFIELNEDRPGPFIRQAIVSGSFVDGNGWFLSGQNLPGFSGGPAGFIDQNGTFQIIGVVVGYKVGDEDNLNSGIIVCHDIKIALELISRNFLF